MAKTVDEAKSHMHDYEAHVRAVEEDLEYYRTKRFEPRIFYSARRGLVTLYDILQAKSSIESTRKLSGGGDGRGRDLVTRIRAVEDGLDDYVKGIGLVSSSSRDRHSPGALGVLLGLGNGADGRLAAADP